MIKKILLTIILILVLTGAAWGIRMYLDGGAEPQGEETFTENRGGIFDFLGIGSDTDTNTVRDSVDTTTRTMAIPTLRQISEEAVSGASFVGTTTIRYTLRGNGHIIETSVDSWDEKKISNTTIPEVQKAIWFNGGNSVIYQREDGPVETRILEIGDRTGTSTDDTRSVVINFLEDSIENIAVSPDTNSFAYIKDSGLGSTVTVGDSSFNIPSQDWIINWKDNDTLLFVTKSSVHSDGYAYTSTLSGNLERVAGGLPGFTAKFIGDNFLYTSDTNRFRLFARSSGGEVEQLLPETLPEKCVDYTSGILCAVPKFVPKGDYPDNWYKGEVSFNDEFLVYDTEFFSFYELYSPLEDLDVIEPQLKGDYLMFINKKDLTLWVLDLSRV